MPNQPTRRAPLAFAAIAASALAACADDANAPDDDAGATDAFVDDATDAATEVEDATPPPPAPEGVASSFDLGAAGDDFFAFPWPFDARRNSDGTLRLDGLPNPRSQALYASLIDAASLRDGFSQLPVVWFRFDAAVAPVAADVVQPASAASNLLLFAVDPDAPDYARLVPTVAATLTADDFVPENVLAVAPLPGWVLEPATRYAAVVLREYGDADGALLGVPEELWALSHGGVGPLAASFAPLWPALATLGIDASRVAAATVFTTGDEAARLHALSDAVRARHAASIANLRVDPRDGAAHPRFCEIIGTATFPQFQRGTPPFNTEGRFAWDPDGLPTLQREEEVPIAITLPRAAMPAGGFPLVVYTHGSGGLSSQAVDRGPTPGVDGEGPAHVLAAHGIATAAAAMPVNPERLPGASSFAYLNLSNLGAFPDTFRQGVIEQRLFLDALLALEIPAATLADCSGLALPDGATTFRFASDGVAAMGQSMGGMYTNMLGAVEPRIEAVVPTGAGGYWSYFILETNLIPGVGSLLARLIGTPHLSFLHPVLHMLQTAWEPAEPFIYVPRLANAPLEGHPARSIYQPAGQGDSYFPTSTYDAITLAYGNVQAGAPVWDRTQAWLTYRGLDGLASFPVAANLTSRDGRPYTGALVQFAGDGVHDPHEIFQYDDAVKHQYGCFLATFFSTGTATIPAPSPLGTACAGM